MQHAFIYGLVAALSFIGFVSLIYTALLFVYRPKGRSRYIIKIPHGFEQGDIETLMKSESVYKCLSCFACVDRCPRGVEPAKLIEAVRLLAIREKGGNHMTADDIPALLDDDMPQQAIVSAMSKYSK